MYSQVNLLGAPGSIFEGLNTIGLYVHVYRMVINKAVDW